IAKSIVITGQKFSNEGRPRAGNGAGGNEGCQAAPKEGMGAHGLKVTKSGAPGSTIVFAKWQNLCVTKNEPPACGPTYWPHAGGLREARACAGQTGPVQERRRTNGSVAASDCLFAGRGAELHIFLRNRGKIELRPEVKGY